jgi:hypothetical protein
VAQVKELITKVVPQLTLYIVAILFARAIASCCFSLFDLISGSLSNVFSFPWKSFFDSLPTPSPGLEGICLSDARIILYNNFNYSISYF